jgi:hypothetical protein
VAPQELGDGCHRQPATGVENCARGRAPAGRDSIKPAGLELEAVRRSNRPHLQALFEIEILKTGAAAAEVGTPFREELQPSRIKRSFGARRLTHASSYQEAEGKWGRGAEG